MVSSERPWARFSKDWRRHPQLRKRLGIKPPALTLLPPLKDSKPDHAPVQKPAPLAAWHYDPQLFRKWPQILAESRGEVENLQEQTEVNEVSLGL
jgi:hypothetical protein